MQSACLLLLQIQLVEFSSEIPSEFSSNKNSWKILVCFKDFFLIPGIFLKSSFCFRKITPSKLSLYLKCLGVKRK